MLFEEEVLSGWGNIPKVNCKVGYPINESQLVKHNINDSIIPRGLGRSYADQSTNKDGYVLKMERMIIFYLSMKQVEF